VRRRRYYGVASTVISDESLIVVDSIDLVWAEMLYLPLIIRLAP